MIQIPVDQAMVLLSTLNRAYGCQSARDLAKEYETGSNLVRRSSLTKGLKVEVDRIKSLIELQTQDDDFEKDDDV